MDIKVEIKEEPSFQDFYSQNARDYENLVKKVKIETSDSDIKPELEGSKCCSENEEHHLMRFNESVKESEIQTKIDIIEEHWWLDREDVHDDIKDGTQADTYATKSSSLYKEDVSSYTSDIFSNEDLESGINFYMNKYSPGCESGGKYESENSVVTNISVIGTDVCSETRNNGNDVSVAFSLEQSRSLQQSNANMQTESHRYRYNICNKAFTRSSDLKTHKLVHEGIKPHTCNICNKAFTYLSDLKKHKLVHEGIKPHTCNICNKAFARLSNLKTHKVVHEGIKPHTCNICNKAFTRLSNLKTHKLSHEGIKPHTCNICNKAFSWLSSLKTHKLVHEGIKPHMCNICNKAFTHLSDLKKHKLVHEGIKPHKCNICDKAFTQSSGLKKHKLVH